MSVRSWYDASFDQRYILMSEPDLRILIKITIFAFKKDSYPISIYLPLNYNISVFRASFTRIIERRFMTIVLFLDIS